MSFRRRTRVLRGRREPLSWFRQTFDSAGETTDVVGADIFDLVAMGLMGDGEDFRATARRIHVTGTFRWEATAVGDASNIFPAGTVAVGIAMISVDTTLPDPSFATGTTQAASTDWLHLSNIALGPTIGGDGDDLWSGRVAFNIDCKAQRKIGVQERLVIAFAPFSNVDNFATAAVGVSSVLWQRTLR